MALLAALLAAAQPQDQPRTVKVAAIQCSSDLGAVQKNRSKLTSLIEQAAANGARIIVLPETSVTGYLSQDLKTNWHLKGWPIEDSFTGKDPSTAAENVPGPSTKHFSALAKELKVYITVPLLETDAQKGADASLPMRIDGTAAPDPRRANAKYYNTVCLISPKGEIVAHYRKLTPWPRPEKSWATPGDRGIQTYDTEYGKVGLAICFDIHTILEKYAGSKLWALLYPIAWVDDSHPAEWFWHRLPARIAAFNHYVIGANWSVDKKQPWFGYGFSTIYAPNGKVLATAKSLFGSEIVYADLKIAPME